MHPGLKTHLKYLSLTPVSVSEYMTKLRAQGLCSLNV